MKFSAVLVALLAIGNHVNSELHVQSSQTSPLPLQPQQTTPGIGRQGRSFPDFLAPFRGIFGRPRGGTVGSAKQLYGVKPAASEINAKPNTGFGGDSLDGFRPSFPNFNDGSSGSSGFGPSEYGGSTSHPPPKSPYHGAKSPSLPLKHRPHSLGGSHSPPSQYSHGGPYSHSHHGGPPDYSQHGHSHGGPYSGPQHAAQHHQPQTYHSYSAEPQGQHHHQYFAGGEGGPQQQQYNEVTSSPNYDHPPPPSHHHHSLGPFHHHGSSSPQDSSSQPPSQHDGPLLPQQQFSRPSLSRPTGPGGKPSQFGSGGFDQGGNFGDFAGSSNFGGPITEFGGPSQQQGGSGKQPSGFFGGPEDYPEQFEEQTRNTREPEIITADNYLQTQGQYSQNYDDGSYYPPGAVGSGPGGPSSSPSGQSSHFGGFGPAGENNNGGGFGGPGQNGPGSSGSGPILRSHPLRSTAAGAGGAGGPRPHGFHAYGSQEESRRHPFLYRPVSSSIRVPGAVDEDAIYGKPMMMSASSKKPVRAAIMKFKGMPGNGKHRATFKSSSPPQPHPEPFRKSEEVIQLESPRDPTMVKAASYQSPAIMEPDTAASGHGHHGMESSNGDRILYHVSGHQGPYSYRYGFDTGRGYNRQFRFEEKDGKGYVTGKYGFYDKHGKLNVVKYSADPKLGFHAERDHGHH